jgi:hypothetical protein
VPSFIGAVIGYTWEMSEFFLVTTDMVRTPSGLILPHKSGKAVAIIGTLLPDNLVREKIEPMGGEVNKDQACVVVALDLFLAAARDVALAVRQNQPPQ